MRILAWTLRIIVFLLLMAVAIKNSSIVTVEFFLGAAWQLPLIFVMLIFFALGAVIGVTAAITTLLRQRREISRLRRRATDKESTPAVSPSH